MPDKKSAQNKKKKKPLLPWISNKYRMVLVNDETFSEERSFRMSPNNVAIVASLVFLANSLLIILLLKLTPLGTLLGVKRSMAGGFRQELEAIYMQLDSLDKEIAARDNYIEKVQKLISGDFEYAKDMQKPEPKTSVSEIGVTTYADVPGKSDATKNLMESVQTERELGALVQSVFLDTEDRIDRSDFISPLKGAVVSDTFSPARSHFGTDLVAPKGSVVKATRKGTVIVATWSADTGHMIGIQHSNNLISFYKHNSAILKKMGDKVEAGEAIAIIGNSGEMSNGPHLHFEIWYNGQPVNPQRYVDL